ncbi:MAG: serpin family protein [Clostridiales bacterium]|nr:serpin family protein [Clostridiales bacterium]
MKKLVSILLSMSVLLSLTAGCSRKTATSSHSHRPGSAEKTPDYETVPEIPYNGSATAVYNLEPAGAAGSNATEEELREAYTRFIFGVMKRCASAAGTGDVLLSPDSILLALDMTAAGASGETLDQMLQTLMPGVGNAEGFQFAVERMNSLQNESLSIANSIWINKADADGIYSDYLDFVTRHFDAKVSILPFNNDAVDRINKWVEEKTNGMIPDLLKPTDLDATSVMALINAITFEGDWKEAYSEEDISEGIFTNSEGIEREVTYLSSTEYTYLESESATGFIKPYEGGKYGFMVILPSDETVNINEYLAGMSEKEYWDLWNRRDNTEVDVRFPEFNSDYRVELPEVLKDMGMVAPFDGGTADFSLMTSGDVFIGKVIHQTHISVNREGTTAAASTAVVMDKNCAAGAGYYVNCDRPFVYAIVDLDTGLPVFLGTCTYQ